MKIGSFVGNIPFIKVVVAWDGAVQIPLFVLETGFSGDLTVNQDIARELRLEIAGVKKAKIAGNQTMLVSTALAAVSMEGMKKIVDVLIVPGPALAGIGLLTQFGCKAIVDCKNRTIVVEKS